MTIFNQALKRIMKSKVKLAVLIIAPALFISMFALQNERSLAVTVVDKDHSAMSAGLVEAVKSMYKVKVTPIEENDIYDKTVSYRTDYSIIIEPGFEQRILEGNEPDVREFYLIEKEKLYYARALIENYISNMKLLAAGTGYDREKFANALEEYKRGKLALLNESDTKGKTSQTRTSMGFLIQFMLYMSVVTAGLILEDKSNGVFFRTFYAPVTLKRYLAENIAAYALVAIMQVTVTLAVVNWVFRLGMGISPFSMYLLLVLFSILCVSFGIWLISFFKKPLYAYLSIVMLTTPLIMIGGCYWPKEFLPDVLRKVGLFFPTTWVMQGVDKLIYDGKNIMDLGLEVLILLIFTGIFLAAGLVKKVDISK